MTKPEIKDMNHIWQALKALLGTLDFTLREIQSDLIKIREKSYGSTMLEGWVKMKTEGPVNWLLKQLGHI